VQLQGGEYILSLRKHAVVESEQRYIYPQKKLAARAPHETSLFLLLLDVRGERASVSVRSDRGVPGGSMP
jgi:hypothetical protein